MPALREFVPTVDQWGNARFRLEGDRECNEGLFVLLEDRGYVPEDVWEAEMDALMAEAMGGKE